MIIERDIYLISVINLKNSCEVNDFDKSFHTLGGTYFHCYGLVLFVDQFENINFNPL